MSLAFLGHRAETGSIMVCPDSDAKRVELEDAQPRRHARSFRACDTAALTILVVLGCGFVTRYQQTASQVLPVRSLQTKSREAVAKEGLLEHIEMVGGTLSIVMGNSLRRVSNRGSRNRCLRLPAFADISPFMFWWLHVI